VTFDLEKLDFPGAKPFPKYSVTSAKKIDLAWETEISPGGSGKIPGGPKNRRPAF
jgi:hypothetical protein